MNLRSYFYFIASCGILSCVYFWSDFKDEALEMRQERKAVKDKTSEQSKPRAIELKPTDMTSPSPSKERPALVQLKELANSKNPVDIFRSYQILADCFQNMKDLSALNSLVSNEYNESYIAKTKPRFEETKRLCEGVSYTDMTHRLDLLNLAVRAKVPGSAIAFFDEGPFGDPDALENRPQDPAVLAWKRQALEQLESAARHGERATFFLLYQLYDDGVMVERDPMKAYAYHMTVYQMEGKPSLGAKKYFALEEEKLSSSQIAEAHQLVNVLTKSCCVSGSK